MHSIQWFWSTGIHDPAWVQAVAAIVLVVLSLVTLIVLGFYAWDTHTLAKVSIEQIELVKKESTFETLRRSQAAYDCVYKANDDVIKISQSIVEGTFGTKPQRPIFPQNWPDATSAFVQQNANMIKPMISLGVTLMAVDLAVEAFFNASSNHDKREREQTVREAVAEAIKDGKSLIEAIKGLG